jgi:hypothetical protein
VIEFRMASQRKDPDKPLERAAVALNLHAS